jgi:hypothetical protein
MPTSHTPNLELSMNGRASICWQKAAQSTSPRSVQSRLVRGDINDEPGNVALKRLDASALRPGARWPVLHLNYQQVLEKLRATTPADEPN